ncbi:MAG: hypothetical protein ABI885_26205 [Gammaproteobacteria bacterium]
MTPVMGTTRNSYANALAEPLGSSQAPAPKGETAGDKRAREKALIDAARRKLLANPQMRIVLTALAR